MDAVEQTTQQATTAHVEAKAVASSVVNEGIFGVLRSWGSLATAGYIAHHGADVKVQLWALAVVALVASPALAKAVIAPRLAALLKRDAPP